MTGMTKIKAKPGDRGAVGSPFVVSFDDDGGLTIKELKTGLVLSVISNERDGLAYVEAYAYDTGKVAHVQAVPTMRGRHPIHSYAVVDAEQATR